MFEIQGTVTTAVCYAQTVEDSAIEQIRRMCSYPLTAGSRVRIMPDVHAGKGCTVGTTMTVTDKVCPNIVGVDIGCGMYTVRLNERAIDLPTLDAAAHFIPSGMRVWEGRQERFDLTALRCFRALRDSRRLERSLGTLGGGNHFIEADRAADGTLYLVIHSGSRNLGKQVAEIYQQLAVDLHMGKEDYFKARDEIIRTYKAAGRRAEIEGALQALKRDLSRRRCRCPPTSAGSTAASWRIICTTWRSASVLPAGTARKWRRSCSRTPARRRRTHSTRSTITSTPGR